MGLEDRNGRLYYYRKERVGDRVRSVYMGSGELAQWAADVMEEERLFSAINRKPLAAIREKGREISADDRVPGAAPDACQSRTRRPARSQGR